MKLVSDEVTFEDLGWGQGSTRNVTETWYNTVVGARRRYQSYLLLTYYVQGIVS